MTREQKLNLYELTGIMFVDMTPSDENDVHVLICRYSKRTLNRMKKGTIGIVGSLDPIGRPTFNTGCFDNILTFIHGKPNAVKKYVNERREGAIENLTIRLAIEMNAKTEKEWEAAREKARKEYKDWWED